MGLSTFTTVFNTINTSVLNPISQIIPFIFGLSPTLKNRCDPKYHVTITATGGSYGASQPWTIQGVLQEKINVGVSSNWGEIGFFNMLGDNDALNLVAGLAGKSLVTSYSSRRRWKGSSPVTISMKLKLEAEINAKYEVTDACSRLQGLALPSGSGYKDPIGGQWFLTPPGPNPISPGLKGETVDINIGSGWLRFSSIIVESVDVVYENRMSAGGPIGAEVTLKISTYELLTKDALIKAYNANMVSEVGNQSATNVAPTLAERDSVMAGTSYTVSGGEIKGAVATINMDKFNQL
jgi:hypothetical protein